MKCNACNSDPVVKVPLVEGWYTCERCGFLLPFESVKPDGNEPPAVAVVGNCSNCKTDPIWINHVEDGAKECGNCGFTYNVTGSPRSGMSLPAVSGIYEISLIADGHQLQVDTIVAASIDSAKRIYEGKYDVNLCNEQYQAVRIGDVV